MTYSILSDFGHRLFVEPRSTVLLPDERELLRELRPQSFLFRARNFDFKAPYDQWLTTFTKLLADIRECVGHEKLLLSLDHEGGRVVRPPRPITRFPYAAKWGDKVADVSKAMAIELASLGMNTSWAPVADVLTNPNSKAIGQRAFSSDTDTVIKQAGIMARTLAENRIAAGAKHFPGYGPVTEDAHYDLPTAAVSFEEWERVHLPPFIDLIEAHDVPFIMTAHIKYPALDPVDQATLSKKILVDILRTQLKYKGVVVADALGMGAIRDEIKGATAIEKALNAELDLFCIVGDSVDLHTAKILATQMLDAVKKGVVSTTLLDRSRERIAIALTTLDQPTPTKLSETTIAAHGALAHELDPSGEWQNFQYIPAGF